MKKGAETYSQQAAVNRLKAEQGRSSRGAHIGEVLQIIVDADFALMSSRKAAFWVEDLCAEWASCAPRWTHASWNEIACQLTFKD